MKKILSIILTFLLLIIHCAPVLAVQKELLYFSHYTDYYLKFSNGNEVRTAVVYYDGDGGPYPAYCIEPSKNGVRRCRRL